MFNRIFYISLVIFTILFHEISFTMDFRDIEKIENGKIIYSKYNYSGKDSIDISDLIVWEHINKERKLFNTIYWDWTDLRIFLLENGYAKLKDETKANIKEIDAQNKAKSNKIAIWKKGYSPSMDQQKKTDWKSIFRFFWKLIIFLTSVGFIGWLIKMGYRKYYIQRRFKLLIIGEPSTGKTALLYNLVDPQIPKAEILKLTTSKAVTQKERLNCIPRGKFEIIPELADVPGSSFATVWDNFLGNNNHALVMVVSPYKLNGITTDGSIKTLNIDNDIDQKYIDIQQGYVQAYIEGGLGSKVTQKPKILILFISKFDIYSKYSPEDSASRITKDKILSLFKDHINSSKTAAQKAGIPFEIVIGSSVEKWNTEKVLDIVSYNLYKI